MWKDIILTKKVFSRLKTRVYCQHCRYELNEGSTAVSHGASKHHKYFCLARALLPKTMARAKKRDPKRFQGFNSVLKWLSFPALIYSPPAFHSIKWRTLRSIVSGIREPSSLKVCRKYKLYTLSLSWTVMHCAKNLADVRKSKVYSLI